MFELQARQIPAFKNDARHFENALARIAKAARCYRRIAITGRAVERTPAAVSIKEEKKDGLSCSRELGVHSRRSRVDLGQTVHLVDFTQIEQEATRVQVADLAL
jgi:hypothetical protein